MSELVFDCFDATSDPYDAAPTLNFHLRIAETTGERVHAMVLRCQMRIEPSRRRYSEEEAGRLLGLFGETKRWGDTMKPVQFTIESLMVQGFTGSTEVTIPVACTYDMEVVATKYFHALDDGDIPLLLLFSGTVFVRGSNGYEVEQIPWHKECTYRLPVARWDKMMDQYFPNSAWLRLRRDAMDELERYKADRALPTWEQTFATLLKEAEAGR